MCDYNHTVISCIRMEISFDWTLVMLHVKRTAINILYIVWCFLLSPSLDDVGLLLITHWGRDKMAAIFSDDIFKCIFFSVNVWISLKISLSFVRNGPINNIPALVQIMAWRRSGDKLLSEPMIINLLKHICVTQPQRVNGVPNRVSILWLFAIKRLAGHLAGEINIDLSVDKLPQNRPSVSCFITTIYTSEKCCFRRSMCDIKPEYCSETRC